MKHIILTLAAALALSACGGPAVNAPANNNSTNSNASAPTAAAPTADALLALDKQANEAYFKGDAKFFDSFLSDKFVAYGGGKRMSKAEVVDGISKVSCDVKDLKLDDSKVSKIDDNTYVLTYKMTTDGTCKMSADGKAEAIPSPVRAASVVGRSGDKWVALFHNENKIMETAASGDKTAATSDEKKPAANEAPKAAEPKKEEPKADAPKKDEKPAANTSASNTAAKPEAAADPNTDALMKIHQSGWEAWKAKDAAKFESMTTKDVSIVDPAGMFVSGQSDVIKRWTQDMKCEGVTSVKTSNGYASAISPTVEMLTLTGTSDGKCDGRANEPIEQVAFYVKEGDAWKLAFMFEQLAKASM